MIYSRRNAGSVSQARRQDGYPVVMKPRTIAGYLAFSVLAASASAQDPDTPRYVGTCTLPTHSEGFHDWPSDELSAIEFIPNPFGKDLNQPISFWIMPDDRSEQAPARIGRIESRWEGGTPEFSGITWTALRDEKGRTFEKNTVDPEAVRFYMFDDTSGRRSEMILWTSEGHAKSGVQPAVYQWTINQNAATKWKLPKAFLHNNGKNPTRGIFQNNGFESLAIDAWDGGPTALTAVERPLIQDKGTGVCRVFAKPVKGGTSYQYGYPLGPAPEGTDPDSLSVAEMLCVGPRRFLVLENAERPDGETVATLWWMSTDAASDLTEIESLNDLGDATPRYIEKKLLLDFSTLPNGEGLGNFEGMDDHGGKLFFVEDNEHGKAGSTRMLVLTMPNGLDK